MSIAHGRYAAPWLCALFLLLGCEDKPAASDAGTDAGGDADVQDAEMWWAYDGAVEGDCVEPTGDETDPDLGSVELTGGFTDVCTKQALSFTGKHLTATAQHYTATDWRPAYVDLTLSLTDENGCLPEPIECARYFRDNQYFLIRTAVTEPGTYTAVSANLGDIIFDYPSGYSPDEVSVSFNDLDDYCETCGNNVTGTIEVTALSDAEIAMTLDIEVHGSAVEGTIRAPICPHYCEHLEGVPDDFVFACCLEP